MRTSLRFQTIHNRLEIGKVLQTLICYQSVLVSDSLQIRTEHKINDSVMGKRCYV